MIIITSDEYPYEGAYRCCIEVPDDFNINEAVKQFKLAKPTDIVHNMQKAEFLWWLEDQYPPPTSGVLELRIDNDDITITEPSKIYNKKPPTVTI